MKKEENHQESGQALIELIIFLPMMMTIYFMISGFANAINGSINQQKVTRSYYYYRLNNNSMAPKPDTRQHTSWGIFGMYFFGWADSLQGDVPVATCYKLSVPMANNQEQCEDAYTDPTTQYIRVGTAYGICGATYLTKGTGAVILPDELGFDYKSVTDVGSCLIQGP